MFSGKSNPYCQKAFAKHLSSAFIVCSPFQLLCAIEAIHEFEIEDYKFVFCLNQGWKRNEQMFSMAKQLNVDYDLIWNGDNENEYFDWTKDVFRIQAQGKYGRVFIADYHGAYYHIIVPLYAKKGAVIAYLDDGNSSILFLKGIIKERKPSNWRKRLNWYRNKKNVVELYRQRRVVKALQDLEIYGAESFFTLYSDIRTRKFAIYPNKLAYISSSYKKEDTRLSLILIVGAAVESYANAVKISNELMESIVWKSLVELRNMHPDDKIIYIPHGRDTDHYIPRYCEMLNIKYEPIEETIETYILASNMHPAAIYSYGSTALYNFHVLYPNAKIINWIVSVNSKYGIDEQRKAVNRYYEQSGIVNEVIWISPKNKTNYETIGSNIKSICQLIKAKTRRVFRI